MRTHHDVRKIRWQWMKCTLIFIDIWFFLKRYGRHCEGFHKFELDLDPRLDPDRLKLSLTSGSREILRRVMPGRGYRAKLMRPLNRARNIDTKLSRLPKLKMAAF
jgi:hypothetical protein